MAVDFSVSVEGRRGPLPRLGERRRSPLGPVQAELRRADARWRLASKRRSGQRRQAGGRLVLNLQSAEKMIIRIIISSRTQEIL